mgnify:FL=1
MISQLSNKVIVVTGGSGGIGSAIVKKLSNCGAAIVSAYHQNPVNENANKNIFCIKVNLIKPEE